MITAKVTVTSEALSLLKQLSDPSVQHDRMEQAEQRRNRRVRARMRRWLRAGFPLPPHLCSPGIRLRPNWTADKYAPRRSNHSRRV